MIKSAKGSRKIFVKTTTIDEYCTENRVVPDGIKIDVEGAERLVIEGGQQTIDRYAPWILLEFHGQYMPRDERQLNWNRIVHSAKKIVFLDGDCNKYEYGVELKSMPECAYFHTFIKY